ncbi:hypothetical protein BDAP_000233 [Binucleata daphniae]
MLCESEIHALMVSTMTKDLDEITCDYVLKYMCNFANRSAAFREISLKKYKKKRSKHYEKYIIVKNVLGVTKSQFKLYEIDNRMFFIKLQIIIDTWNSKDADYKYLAENTMMQYLEDLFHSCKEKYLKIKILQLLQLIIKTYKIEIMPSFVKSIAKILDKCTITAKHKFDLSYIYQICSFLPLFRDLKHEKISKFVATLLDSKNIYEVVSGIELVLNHECYHTIAAIRLIKIKYDRRKSIQFTRKLINTTNYQEVYNKIQYTKSHAGIKISKRRLKLFCAAYECFYENFLVELVIDHPYIISYIHKSFLPSQLAIQRIFVAINQSVNTKYYIIIKYILYRADVCKTLLQSIFDFFVKNHDIFRLKHSFGKFVDYTSCIVSLSIKLGYNIENHFTLIKIFAKNEHNNKKYRYYIGQLVKYYQIFAQNKMIMNQIPILYSVDSLCSSVRKKINVKILSNTVVVLDNIDVYTLDTIKQVDTYTNIVLELIDFECKAFTFKYEENGIQYNQEIDIND